MGIIINPSWLQSGLDLVTVSTLQRVCVNLCDCLSGLPSVTSCYFVNDVVIFEPLSHFVLFSDRTTDSFWCLVIKGMSTYSNKVYCRYPFLSLHVLCVESACDFISSTGMRRMSSMYLTLLTWAWAKWARVVDSNFRTDAILPFFAHDFSFACLLFLISPFPFSVLLTAMQMLFPSALVNKCKVNPLPPPFSLLPSLIAFV